MSLNLSNQLFMHWGIKTFNTQLCIKCVYFTVHEKLIRWVEVCIMHSKCHINYMSLFLVITADFRIGSVRTSCKWDRPHFRSDQEKWVANKYKYVKGKLS
jgi:hypothetical protein